MRPANQLILKPLPQPGAAVRFLMESDALAHLADGDDADVHQVVVRVLQPLRDTRVRLWTGGWRSYCG
jgi:hypothetical protein